MTARPPRAPPSPAPDPADHRGLRPGGRRTEPRGTRHGRPRSPGEAPAAAGGETTDGGRRARWGFVGGPGQRDVEDDLASGTPSPDASASATASASASESPDAEKTETADETGDPVGTSSQAPEATPTADLPATRGRTTTHPRPRLPPRRPHRTRPPPKRATASCGGT
ncbi:hypothetical protein LV779_29320 [Streptomyces thinghirensis]|nr:hypothetical protein [Streptomyces thinghirensis]